MADVLTQPSPQLGFKMATSPFDSPVEIHEPPFVDASDQPLPLPTDHHTEPVRNPFPWTLESSDHLQAPKTGDMQTGGGHRKHKSLALPEFSFNPGAASSSNTDNLSPPTSPHSPSPQSSPSKRHGHRRIRTEFAGGDSRHQSPIVSSVSPVEKLNEELAKQENTESAAAPVTRAPSVGRKGHKHRRSAAISVDLSQKDRTSILGRPGSSGAKDGLPASSPTFGTNLLQANSSSARTSKSSSPVRVSFADEVAVIPRRSMPTLQNPGIAPVLRPTKSSDGAETPHEILGDDQDFAGQADSLQPSGLDTAFEVRSEESLGDFPSVSIVEHANDGLMPFLDDSAPVLNENFDEDPTATIEVTHHRSLSQPASPRSPNLAFEPSKESDNVIDLDSANDVDEATAITAEDLKNLRAKSFSAARRSMHSGGLDQPVVRAGAPLHRRTESAPTGTNPFFGDRPSLPRLISDTADSASEKGFQMENVFEEDEEEVKAAEEEEERSRLESRRQSGQQSFGLGIESPLMEEHTYAETPEKRTSVILRDDTPTPTNEMDIPSRQHTIRRASSNRHSMVLADAPEDDEQGPIGNLQPPILMDEPPDSRSNSFDYSARPISQPLPSLTAPPWINQQDASSFGSTPHEPSTSSAWSTPKLDTAATSMSDAPQLHLPHAHNDSYTASSVSTDGIPSLISSNSTMSGTHQYAGSNASPSTPSGTRSRNSNMSMGSQAERRRKRSSIVSLSHLMSMSRSGGANKSNLSVEPPDFRCQTSSGLSNVESPDTPITPGKEKRMKRLSRALKFWKPKDEMPHG